MMQRRDSDGNTAPFVRTLVVFVALVGSGWTGVAIGQEGAPVAPLAGSDEEVDLAAPFGGEVPLPPGPEGVAPRQAGKVDLSGAMQVDTSFAMTPGTQGGGLRLNGARPRTYTVVRGDTLWDISSRFWGDPYFWPTLWSYNPSIGNAHFIYPEDVLRFTTGSPVRPPGMSKGGEEAEPPVTASNSLPSGVMDSAGQVDFSAASNPLECAPPVPFVSSPPGAEVRSNLLGFLSEEKVRPIGKLVRSPEEHEYLADRDLVYLTFSRLSEVSCGDIYTLYRPQEEKLRHPRHRFQKIGTLYAITGEVRIVDINDHVATAQITRAYTEIQRDDLVAGFMPVEREVAVRAATKELDGYIIGSLLAREQSLSYRDVVYIDRGDVDGLVEGDTFYILRSGDGLLAPSRKDNRLPDRVVGKIVVLEAGEAISTAVITEAADSLVVGDRISMQVF